IIAAPEKFNIVQFVNDFVTEIHPIAKENQKIVHNHTGNTDVLLDPRLLKNILFNLLSNAIKFSSEGKTVEINSLLTVNHLKLSVKDEGMGISEEDQKHLFERFFRGYNATHIQGTGLGLSIIANYVELMNGSISFESREKKGTTF